ncbi:MAG: ABC transporter ATP-binding protein [Phycisphaerae bacterium]|jgi:lipoprotein-releasing system ATP-binding protein|nr:ABC transporter ATP-binding protein [Phycisphaerae bacterium]MDP7636391.1 ABC transporter ATP-binding protein [Phycisphaerae bacterium]
MSSQPAILVEGLCKSYRLGRQDLHVLRGVSFSVAPGEFVAVVGASGSGKSTLLHLVGLLDRPDRGQVILDGRDAAALSAMRRNDMRCREVGFVFQFYHLFTELNVLDNALLPARVGTSLIAWPSRRGTLRRRARGLLEQMGLQGRLKHRPSELSGGERQRLAIARALMNEPKILLADEPTGNLDSGTGRKILNVLEDCNRRGQTILVVTHDASIAAEAHRTLHLTDGRITDPKR